jgi:hypothetical protein
MTSRTLLQTFRAVRDVVADIVDTVAAVDEHVGRFQIYGADEELARALARAKSLAAKAARLELELRRCARIAEREHGARGRCNSEAGAPDLERASVPQRANQLT